MSGFTPPASAEHRLDGSRDRHLHARDLACRRRATAGFVDHAPNGMMSRDHQSPAPVDSTSSSAPTPVSAPSSIATAGPVEPDDLAGQRRLTALA